MSQMKIQIEKIKNALEEEIEEGRRKDQKIRILE